MDIKIALTSGWGIYHDTLGILEDFDGNTVVFCGSANSTASGYKNNYEKIRVFKSWVQSDIEHIEDEIAEFDSLRNNTNPHVSIYDYTASAKAQILKVIWRHSVLIHSIYHLRYRSSCLLTQRSIHNIRF